ncbi:unnamed protein product, partial [Rangifer tarandus platyrhynchus]
MDECQEAVEEWMEPGPGNSPKACPPAQAGHGPSRREGRPKHEGRSKSLNPRDQAPCRHPEELQDQDQDLGGKAQLAPRGGKILAGPGEESEGLRAKASVQPPSQNVSQFPMRSIMHEVPATPVHPSDAVVNAEEILLRLIGSQGSQQTRSPQQSLGPSPACSGSAPVGVVPETVAPPQVVSVSHRALVYAGKCRQLQPVVGTAQRRGSVTQVHFTGAV